MDDDHILKAIARALGEPDWSLDRLLKLADAGVAVSVTLFTSGVIIEGELTTREVWADKLDADLDVGMASAAALLEREHGQLTSLEAAPGAPTTEEIEVLRNLLRTSSFRSMVDESRREEADLRKTREALSEDSQAPLELQDEFDERFQPVREFALQNVVVADLAGVHDRHVSTLRVMRGHIVAWHVGRTSQYVGPA
jgi:hypothetical protein